MTIIDDLKAAGIECPPDIIGWFVISGDPRPWYSVKACAACADAALDAALRLAIGYKARVDELESARQCGAENPHGMIPRQCPSCGEEMIPLPCMHLAMDSYKDGKRYVEARHAWQHTPKTRLRRAQQARRDWTKHADEGSAST